MATMTLTVNLDDASVERAKELAAARGMTVSQMVEQLLHVVTRADRTGDGLGPLTKAAKGLLKGLPDKSYRELVEDALSDKFGSGE